jgi:hypothetical protein
MAPKGILEAAGAAGGPFVAAQFHRVQADLVLARQGSDDSARGRATDLYRRSITIARTNRTLAFEIPSVLALARLELGRGELAMPLDGLNATLAGVTASADLPALLELRELVGVIEGLLTPETTASWPHCHRVRTAGGF